MENSLLLKLECETLIYFLLLSELNFLKIYSVLCNFFEIHTEECNFFYKVLI